jgi:hypothetical protein
MCVCALTGREPSVIGGIGCIVALPTPTCIASIRSTCCDAVREGGQGGQRRSSRPTGGASAQPLAGGMLQPTSLPTIACHKAHLGDVPWSWPTQ